MPRTQNVPGSHVVTTSKGVKGETLASCMKYPVTQWACSARRYT